jgi:cytochrome c5
MLSKLSLFGMGSAVAAIVLASVIVGNTPASAKPEFAAQTGKPCGACHVSPSGGGPLTGAGEKFKKTLK